MHYVALNLDGAMQSWGSDSRFRTRRTRAVPTKSGIVGLICAALGRSRDDDISDVAKLRLAVRTERPGTIIEDFHTARKHGAENSNLSRRHYLSDARFIALVGTEDKSFADEIAVALQRPVFAPSLGRRACVPSAPVFYGQFEADSFFEAFDRIDARDGIETVAKPVERDAEPGEAYHARLHDVPVSFSDADRGWIWRGVVTETHGESVASAPESDFVSAGSVDFLFH